MNPSKIEVIDSLILVYSNNSNDIFKFDYSIDLLNKLCGKAWSVTMHGKYLRTRIRNKDLYAHHLVLPKLKEHEVDHINKDTTDNRKCNLRYATSSQNKANRHNRQHTSKYRGVSFDEWSHKWRVQVKHNNIVIYQKRYANELDAARAYDKIAKKIYGKFANLNFKN